jgi:hypothetical protein
MYAFNESKLKVLEQALQLAWDRFLKAGMLNEQNVNDAKQLIARKIFRLAGNGEWDAWRLARDAVSDLCEASFPRPRRLKPASRRMRRPSR